MAMSSTIEQIQEKAVGSEVPPGTVVGSVVVTTAGGREGCGVATGAAVVITGGDGLNDGEEVGCGTGTATGLGVKPPVDTVKKVLPGAPGSPVASGPQNG